MMVREQWQSPCGVARHAARHLRGVRGRPRLRALVAGVCVGSRRPFRAPRPGTGASPGVGLARSSGDAVVRHRRGAPALIRAPQRAAYRSHGCKPVVDREGEWSPRQGGGISRGRRQPGDAAAGGGELVLGAAGVVPVGAPERAAVRRIGGLGIDAGALGVVVEGVQYGLSPRPFDPGTMTPMPLCRSSPGAILSRPPEGKSRPPFLPRMSQTGSTTYVW